MSVSADRMSCGRLTKVAPPRGREASRKAFSTTSGMLSGTTSSTALLVTAFMSDTLSMLWCVCLSRIERGTAPPSATTGSPSVVAVASPVARFETPGPEVTSTTPGFPVSRPTAPAMKAAFCSWRHRTSRGPSPSTSASASKTASTFAPGIPEDELHPMLLQAVDQQSRTGARRHQDASGRTAQ